MVPRRTNEPIFDVMETVLFETGLFERKGAAARQDLAAEVTPTERGHSSEDRNRARPGRSTESRFVRDH